MQKLFALLFILIFLNSCIPKKLVNGHPNVVMIVVDDLNSWVSFLKNFNEVKTPNLDKLAQKSFVFKNAHAPATLCNPSRTAVITGKLPSSTGIYNNNQSAKDFIIKSQTKTIFHHFKTNGYYLMGSGKLFHVKNDIPIFDEFFRPKRDLTNIGSATPWAYFSKSDFNHVDKQVSDWAVERLKKSYNKPFFMNIGFFFPHHPWILPKKYFDYYPLDKIKIPETLANDYDDIPIIARTRIIKFLELNSTLKHHDKLKENIQAYLAAVTYMDEQLGKILTALETSPYAKNTIIVFWSDHGYHLGEKHTLRKTTLWNPSSQVPFLIQVPGQRGQINSVVSLIDIFPSLNELCNLPALNDLDGYSLVNLMNHKEHKREMPVITVQDFGNYAIRNDNWKYIKYIDGSEELYKIDIDSNEFHNLAQIDKYQVYKNYFKKYIPNKPKKYYSNEKKMVWISGFDSNNKKFYNFWIDSHEVTNEEFEAFVKKTNYQTNAETLETPEPGSLVFSPPNKKIDNSSYLNWWKFIPKASWQDPQGNSTGILGRLNHPVVQVSYNDAYAFCKYYGKRLPSENEWVFAFKKGKEIDLKDKKNRWSLNIYQGNFPYKDSAEDGFAGTAPVMSYKPNALGIYDLRGNVWEWVSTKGKNLDTHKIKGGSFLCGNHCKGFDPEQSLDMKDDESTDHIGFRCVD
ncbi:MAG: hypothetical protein RLZZ361_236 [Cyanobacteriota bacterium]|jgi:arylsulfatase A-like enzyme